MVCQETEAFRKSLVRGSQPDHTLEAETRQALKADSPGRPWRLDKCLSFFEPQSPRLQNGDMSTHLFHFNHSGGHAPY